MTVDTHIFERDTLHAFCRHTHVALPPLRHGSLSGLTFGLKDIYDVAGFRTGFGNPDWLATHEPATHTASIVDRLLHAGATLVGRTHTEEMAFSLTGENAHYGTPVNPAAPSRVPGGSSSGSAAAVAGDLVDFAIGSDTGGSVRAPASFCGIYGIRPTHGRIALDGVLPLAPSFDTCGWFARRAPVLARVGRVLLGDSPPATARAFGRLFIATDCFALATPATAEALHPAIAHIERLLGAAEPVVVSDDGLRPWYRAFRALQYGEIWRAHGEWIERVKPTFGAQMQLRFDAVAANDRRYLVEASAMREQVRSRLDLLLEHDAVLLMPTVPDVAPLLDRAPAETITFRERALELLCVAGLGGLPQVNLPYATLDDAPVGLSIVAARGNDEMLLEVAVALERTLTRV